MEQENEVGFVRMTQTSFLEAALDEKLNTWTVKQTITQRRKVAADSEWEQADVMMTWMSKDIDIAMAQVFLSMEGYLITRNHDLFAEPEASPVAVADGSVIQ